MKKYILFLLLFAFVTSVSHSQEMPDGEIVCSEGEIKGITTINTWTNHNLKYYIQNYASHGLTNYQCLTAIQNAFNKWSQYSDFTFTRIYSSSLADIIIKWVTDSDNCGLNYPTAKAHSTQGETTGTPPGFIHFNDDFTFTMTSSGNNLEAIALREIGHLLGLPYVSITSAVMYVDNVQTLNLTGYDLNTFYILYAFPGTLTGPKLVSSSGEYEITNFPSGLTTSWSINDTHYNNTSYVQGNYNGNGTCRINLNPSYDLTDATLTAVVKKGGITVKTLQKSELYAYEGFKGSYTSGNLSGSIPYTYFFNIKANATTYIKSANFFGATVTYGSSGATPSIWTFSPTYGDLTFVTSNTSAPVIINVLDGCENNYTLYAMPSSYSINVSNGESGITVTLVEDGDASKDFTPDESWTLEIINAATRQVMATQSSKNRSETISTVGWPKGIYVVKVTIGKEELTEKIMVK